jgi:co-chaperonin GroES (HSP10)
VGISCEGEVVAVGLEVDVVGVGERVAVRSYKGTEVDMKDGEAEYRLFHESDIVGVLVDD